MTTVARAADADHGSASTRASTVMVGTTPVSIVRDGSGPPLLILHDELGFPGWMQWNRTLGLAHDLVVPLQPGFGVTPRVDWFRSCTDVAAFYGRMVRELDLGPIDVMGFSLGGFIAAEMVAACPRSVRRLILVSPLGIKPPSGQIADILAMTIRDHVRLTVSNADAAESAHIYGGEMTPDQFVLFEAARAETARLAWSPYLHNPSLPHRLEGIGGLPTTVIWGCDDRLLPRSAVEEYARVIPNARLIEMPGVGHRPEIEDPLRFLDIATEALEA